MKILEKFYSPRELGWMLGFSAAHIRRLARAGAFSPGGDPGRNIIHVASDIRIPPSGVNAWLEANRVRDPLHPGRRRRVSVGPSCAELDEMRVPIGQE